MRGVRDFEFQHSEARIIKERRQPRIEARRADSGGAIVARLIEGRERFVLVAQRLRYRLLQAMTCSSRPVR